MLFWFHGLVRLISAFSSRYCSLAPLGLPPILAHAGGCYCVVQPSQHPVPAPMRTGWYCSPTQLSNSQSLFSHVPVDAMNWSSLGHSHICHTHESVSWSGLLQASDFVLNNKDKILQRSWGNPFLLKQSKSLAWLISTNCNSNWLPYPDIYKSVISPLTCKRCGL